MKLKLPILLLSLIFLSNYASAQTVVLDKQKSDLISPVLNAKTEFKSISAPVQLIPVNKPIAPIKPKLADLSPTKDQAKASIIVANVLASLEYDKKPFDSVLSKAIYNKYLNTLDSQHLFLTKEDLEKFDFSQKLMAQMVLKGRLELAFAIYDAYRSRVQQRFDYSLSLLEQPFDFSKNESIDLDRSKAPWPSEAQADDLWRKRVKNDYLRLKVAGVSDKKIISTLKERYTNLRNQILSTNSESVAEIFIDSYAQVTDPHTNYFSPISAQDFNVEMSLSLDGIGAELEKRNDVIQVREVIAGSPADKSGEIHSGDKIVGVGQGFKGPMQDVLDWRIEDLVNKVRGKPNSVVRLEILPHGSGPDGKTKTVTLVRQKITLEDEAAQYKIINVNLNDEQKKIAIITIPSFYEDFDAKDSGAKNYKSVSTDVERIIQNLKSEHINGIVLDLRNNGGGSLPEAANLSGLFLGGNLPVVQIRDAQGNVESVHSETALKPVWDGPLAVLVDRLSASASEIFAAAMADYKRAVIIGNNTWGKGSVQSVDVLNDFLSNPSKANLGSLKWTVQKFFRVNGSSTQLKGVAPDIVFPSFYDPKEVGESSYDNAMKWSKIEPIKYTLYKKGILVNSLPILNQLHEQRIQKSAAWQLINDEYAYTQSVNTQDSMSLNYQVRLQERNEKESKRQQFKTKAKAIGESDLEVFSLDDGLTVDEANLNQETTNDTKPKKQTDPFEKEAANIVGDLSRMMP